MHSRLYGNEISKIFKTVNGCCHSLNVKCLLEAPIKVGPQLLLGKS